MKKSKCVICGKKGICAISLNELSTTLPTLIGVDGSNKYFCKECDEKGLAEDLKKESRNFRREKQRCLTFVRLKSHLIHLLLYEEPLAVILNLLTVFLIQK